MVANHGEADAGGVHSAPMIRLAVTTISSSNDVDELAGAGDELVALEVDTLESRRRTNPTTIAPAATIAKAPHLN
jgi:hypothetical protein